MLAFTTTSALAFTGAVAVVGTLVLLRGQRRGRAVSSIKLWQGLEGAAGTRRRRIDPVWLMVLLGTILASLLPAGPVWRSGEEILPLQAMWAVRDIPATGEAGGRYAEGWLKVIQGETPAGAQVLVELDGGVAQRPMDVQQAQAGVAFPVAEGKLPARVGLALADAQGRQLTGETVLERLQSPPFGWLTVGGAVDPALKRFFELHPRAKPGDPTATPLVVLAGGGNASDLLAQQDVRLVVAGPGVQLPGLTWGEMKTTTGTGWTPERGKDLPASVRLDRTHVRAYRQVQLSPGSGGDRDWQVMASVNGSPWLLCRDLEGGGQVVCMMSQISAETDWAADSSFVVFWGEMTDRALGQPGASGEWRVVQQEAATRTSLTIHDLRPWAGTLAVAMLLSGAGGLWCRGRHITAESAPPA